VELKQEIAGRFKISRESIGISPPELARKIGAASQTIRDYEDGRSIPGGAAIAGMSNLGINANWLLTGAGPMRLSDLQAPSSPPGALDPARLRLALTLSEDAARAAAQPMTSEQKADLVMTFYMRLTKQE